MWEVIKFLIYKVVGLVTYVWLLLPILVLWAGVFFCVNYRYMRRPRRWDTDSDMDVDDDRYVISSMLPFFFPCQQGNVYLNLVSDCAVNIIYQAEWKEKLFEPDASKDKVIQELSLIRLDFSNILTSYSLDDLVERNLLWVMRQKQSYTNKIYLSISPEWK